MLSVSKRPAAQEDTPVPLHTLPSSLQISPLSSSPTSPIPQLFPALPKPPVLSHEPASFGLIPDSATT